MQFPFGDYLDQLFFDTGYPLILSPKRYWQAHCVRHLNLCLTNDWIEHCWQIDYIEYTTKYTGIVTRHHLEENDAAFLEHCWLEKPLSYDLYCHSLELFLETHAEETNSHYTHRKP